MKVMFLPAGSRGLDGSGHGLHFGDRTVAKGYIRSRSEDIIIDGDGEDFHQLTLKYVNICHPRLPSPSTEFKPN
ncbi:hypothetical protein PTI98_008078 [Pleurotus ostreatus]|nr:hypothetical protein PTI98_008078 [Pleurotus ostreatus]